MLSFKVGLVQLLLKTIAWLMPTCTKKQVLDCLEDDLAIYLQELQKVLTFTEDELKALHIALVEDP